MALAFDPAYLDLAIKAMVLVLLLGAGAALLELIRYLRVLRYGRELNHRLTLQRVHEEIGNDPRLAAAPPAARPSLFGRAVRKSLQTVGVLTLLIAATAAMAMPFLGPWLEHPDDLEKADYIMPLPGDSRRLFKAAELYKQGYAPRVVLSRGSAAAERIGQLRIDSGYPGLDFEEWQLRTLEKAGVPRGSVDLVDAGDASLADAAEALRRHLDGRKAKVIVVAAGIHAMRTRLMFSDTLPRARIFVAAAQEGGSEPWWRSHESALETLGEASRVAHYWFGGGRRSEPAAATAGAKPMENVGSGQIAPRR